MYFPYSEKTNQTMSSTKASNSSSSAPVEIIRCGAGVSPEIFEKAKTCPQFSDWLSSQHEDFKYHSIVIDAVTMFGSRPGLIHITTEVTFHEKPSKRIVFIRGGSVGVLLLVKSIETSKVYTIYVRQPRNAVGATDFIEIPAGMLDGATGTLASTGVAVKELQEEADLTILPEDLVHLLQMIPSAGGCDEWIDLFLVFLSAKDSYIQGLIGKKTGELGSDEQITLGIAEFSEFEKMCLNGRCKDAKAMSAIFAMKSLVEQGRIEFKPSREIDSKGESKSKKSKTEA